MPARVNFLKIFLKLSSVSSQLYECCSSFVSKAGQLRKKFFIDVVSLIQNKVNELFIDSEKISKYELARERGVKMF